MSAVAILVAAGRGERMGADRPKAFLDLGGQPLLLRAARAFETGVALDPGDGEAQVGEVFAYLALGAMRTAVVTLRQRSLTQQNLFLSELSLDEVLGVLGEGV